MDAVVVSSESSRVSLVEGFETPFCSPKSHVQASDERAGRGHYSFRISLQIRRRFSVYFVFV